jgi:glucosyl-3-phosphoglycerate synthase
VQSVVIGLDGATAAEAGTARRQITDARISLLHRTGAAGKGANLRDCLAALQQDGSLFAVAMHDCDIRNYSREYLARLCWPVLHPEAGWHACKGYYARTAAGLHGRVFRLFLQPLLRACTEHLPPHPWLQFLTSLRYPLSGELCVRTAVLPDLPLPDGWDVELALLSSLHRQNVPMCQSELCPAYDHKHQEPAALAEMAAVLHSRLMQTLHDHGVHSGPLPPALLSAARLHAEQAVALASLMAAMNGLRYDAEAERRLAASLMQTLK